MNKWGAVNFSKSVCLKATSEFGSFSIAAQFRHVTQPNLSGGATKLEEELVEKYLSELRER